MFVTIKTPQGVMDKNMPDDENSFYRELSEIMVSLSDTGSVKVSTPIGNASYSLSKRSGTLLIQESDNNLNFPSNKRCSTYPTVYLTCVNEEYNNYKFYKLEAKGDLVIASYGRIGAAKGEIYGERSCEYPLRMFWIKYQEKLSKGYVDKSEIYLDNSNEVENQDKEPENEAEEKNINQLAVDLYQKLIRFAKHTIETTCKSLVITQGMVNESRRLLNLLYQTTDLDSFNKVLKELLAVCPRKVWKVDMLLAEDKTEIPEIIQREEDLVNAMQVLVPGRKKSASIMDKFTSEDIIISEASREQREKVMDMLDPSLRKKVVNIWRVNPKAQRKRFLEYMKERNITEVKNLWHGSRNENWLSIIENGLLLHPNAVITGKMFGDGIYFAPGSMKSWNYTSGRNAYWTKGMSSTAFMGLYATAYGKPLDVQIAHSYSENTIGDKNCVHAHAGMALRNDEIIFYNESAMLLNFLVEFAA